MELMYPVAIIIGLIIAIFICFKKFNKKTKYTEGKKVANTKYIKDTPYYKAKVRRYKTLTTIIKILNALCIIIASVLVARPITIQNKAEAQYNRDIIMGIDISTSECEVNIELIKKFKEIIPDIEGDRIGIVIYNTAPIVYCPLTNDYTYVEECLNEIEKQMKIVVANNGSIPYGDGEEGAEISSFWYGGAIANSDKRGSSLVGDGLAGTVFSFPDIEENKERTRIIIFATDNDVAGQEEVSLEDACTICKQYGVNLYAYCPSVEMNIYTSKEKIAKYKKAVEENAGGKFYTGKLEKMATNIVKEIKETKTSLLKKSKKTYVTDHPEIFLIITIIIFLILLIIEKRIKI